MLNRVRKTAHAALVVCASLPLSHAAMAQTAPVPPAPAGSAQAPAAEEPVWPAPEPTTGWEEAPAAAPAPAPATSDAPPRAAPAAPVTAAPPGATSMEYAYPPPASPPPRVYRYKPGRAIPAGYELEERPRTGLIIAGAITFGVVYGISSLVAAANTDSYDANVTNWLYLPVFGPFIAASQLDTDCSDYGCNDNASAAVLVWDGVVQAGGAAMLAVGLFVPTKWLVPSPNALSLRVTPLKLGRHAHGIGVSGRF